MTHDEMAIKTKRMYGKSAETNMRAMNNFMDAIYLRCFIANVLKVLELPSKKDEAF